MAEFETRRIALPTGVELNAATAGDPAKPAIILLHGFPESHRTWRHQILALAADHYVIAPDQRGYGGSSKPDGVEHYTADKPVADLMALADALDIKRFTLVGHDWGGAIAWMAALHHPLRVKRLVILNAPHPKLFQQSLFDDPDQRKASQYINLFRDTRIDQGLTGRGLERFFSSHFAQLVVGTIAGEEKARYLADWGQPGAMTAMLNWYRASDFVVPEPGEEAAKPLWLHAPFPPVLQPTLVIWGMKDEALLPVQLEGLGAVAPRAKIVRIEDAGHFVTWEQPDAVNAALLDWLSAA